MAMSGLGARNGGRRGRYRPLAEINVTPLVDVMLVLLIIFMVTAPLMTSGVSVDLPKTDAKPLNADSDAAHGVDRRAGQDLPAEPAGGTAGAGGQTAGGRRGRCGPADFRARRQGYLLRAVVQVMATIAQGGFTKVALLAQPPAGVPAGAAPATSAPATPLGTAAGKRG